MSRSSNNRFVNIIVATISIGAICIVASSSSAAPTATAKTDVTYNDDGATIVFGNGSVELALVKKTGYIRRITNKVSGREYKLENEGSWPFGMELGLPNVPKLLTIEVVGNGFICWPSQMGGYNRVGQLESFKQSQYAQWMKENVRAIQNGKEAGGE